MKLAELSKLTNERKTADIRQYNLDRLVEYAEKNGGSLKAVKRGLGMGNIRCMN